MYQRRRKNFITFINFNLKSKNSLINNTNIEKFVKIIKMHRIDTYCLSALML